MIYWEKLLKELLLDACPTKQEVVDLFVDHSSTFLKDKCKDLKFRTYFGIIADINNYLVNSGSGIENDFACCFGIILLHVKQERYTINPEWIHEYPELQRIVLIDEQLILNQLQQMEENAANQLNNSLCMGFNSWLHALDKLLPKIKAPSVFLFELYKEVTSLPINPSEQEHYLVLKNKIRNDLYNQYSSPSDRRNTKPSGFFYHLGSLFFQSNQTAKKQSALLPKMPTKDKALNEIYCELQQYYLSFSAFSCCASARLKIKIFQIIELIDNKALTTFDGILKALETVCPLKKRDAQLQDIITSLEVLIADKSSKPLLKMA